MAGHFHSAAVAAAPPDLLTMRSDQQPVATDGNGFGLFSPFAHAVDLPLVATGCNRGAP
jgi:hypothetical protein